MNDISIVVPVYNEFENLSEFYERLEKTLSQANLEYQLIFVNDGSTDDSLKKILSFSKSNSKVFYIDFSRNFGHQIAVSAGLKYANRSCTVIIDSDLQDPPELILELYKKYKEGFDVVYAKRSKRKGESFLKKITAKFYYRILKRLVSFEIPLDVGDFRLVSKPVVIALNKMPEKNKFLRGQIAWLGFRQTDVLFTRETRKSGNSGYSYSKMFRFAFDGITGFSDKPLIFVSRLGFIISLLSLFIIFFATFSHFILDETITGWTSLIISVTFLGGIQLLSIGVIGEYISRINTNVQERPLYVVKETNLKAKDNDAE